MVNWEEILLKRQEVLFDEFRKIEGIEQGKLSKALGIEKECKVLVNRRYKEEHGIIPSDFEEALANEEGYLIRANIAEFFQKPRFQALEKIPFPEYDIILEQLEEIISPCVGCRSKGACDMVEITEDSCKTLKKYKSNKR